MEYIFSERISRMAARAAASVLFVTALAQGAGIPAFNIEERTTSPLMVADQLWESRSLGFLGVIETNGAWKCWYSSIDTNYVSDDDQLLCYATSTNGVDWVKPNLGRVSYNGSTANNIVLRSGGAGGYVFWDSHADRYRMISIRNVSGSFVLFGKDSSNGLDWVEDPNPIFPFNADTQNACMWDGDRYRLYPRMWTGGIGTPNSYRMVGYSESTTFSNFPAPTVILATDALDPPTADFYNSAATKLADNLYVMFPSAYYDLDNGASGVGAETAVPHMAVSTNGVNFVKVGHAPAVPLGGPTNFDRGSIYVGPGCVPGPRPNTWWFHYVGHTNKHNQAGSYSGGLGRFLLTVLPASDGGAVPLPYKTGLLTWLRADDLDADRIVTNNPVDGTPVAVWKDSNNAAAGYHGAQANATKQPRYRTAGGPNNMPRVEFDGTNDFLELPTIAYSNWTVFTVGRMAAGPSGTALAFADYGPTGASYPILALYRSAGAFTPYNRDGTSHTIRADDTNGWSRFAIRSAWVSSAALNYRVTDGSNTYAGAGTPAAGYAAAAMNGDLAPTLGDLPPATGAFAANLELSEFLLFDHTLSPVDRAAVEGYLKAKYYPPDTNPAPPSVAFSASPTTGPAPLPVLFSDTSTGTITNRMWNFGDGQTTNTSLTTVEHTYALPGSYSVSLTASGPLGTSTVTRAGYIAASALTYRTGLLTWLRAEDMDGDGDTTDNPTDGAAIALWRDSNTGGKHAAQNNAVNQPTYRTTDGPNSKPLVAFDGTNDFLELPDLSYSNTSWTIFMVGRMPAGPTTTMMAFADRGIYGPGAPSLFMYRLTGTLTFTPLAKDVPGNSVRADDTNGWSRYAIRTAWINDKTVYYRVSEGSNAYTGAGARINAFANGSIAGNDLPTIGALPPSPCSNFANLELSEFLLFDHTLSEVDRAAVENYLAATYYPATPVAAFSASPTNGTAPLAVALTDTSTGTITNRAWNFGDGQTTNTSLTTVEHSYALPGSYSVSLTASGPLGMSTATRANYISVKAVPVAGATGGTIGGSGKYRTHTFTTNGTFTVYGAPLACEVLVVAGGGGGGGRFGGGGGAGGLIYTNLVASGTNFIMVGSGGQGAGNGTYDPGGAYACSNGQDSMAFGLTTMGGGRGVLGTPGGSGGGREGSGAGGLGTTGQGHNGGTGVAADTSYMGGGGGGAGGPGGDAVAPSTLGAGGGGLTNSISGFPQTYAVGGTGGSWSANTQGAAGAPNTGNGGGGSGGNANAGGAGGSGIVIVRYFVPPPSGAVITIK